MEGEIGRFRRRHLTPIPHVGSLEALNAALAAADARDNARRIGGRTETVGEAAARELLLLAPLPTFCLTRHSVRSSRRRAQRTSMRRRARVMTAWAWV